MHKEPGERRDFLPPRVAARERFGATEIVVEEGYGAGVGCTTDEYLQASSCCRVGDYADCCAQDMVLVLRYPGDDVVSRLRPGTTLVSMVHFPTRPGRVKLLAERGVRAVSLDSVADDNGRRLVENLESVGWNGVKSGFRALKDTWPELLDPKRGPAHAVVVGAGAVGAHAVRAAAAWGDRAWRAQQVARGVKGVEVTVVDYDVTSDEAHMRALLRRADLLVDATLRPDVSKPAIPNAWLGELPAHAVLVDLSVDPYDFSGEAPEVKGLEGVPEGNLDQYLFLKDDPAWDRLDPRVDTRNRRVALSCYSWPGIEPRACMEVYGTQLEPVMRAVLSGRLDQPGATLSFYERAVGRGELSRWRANHAH